MDRQQYITREQVRSKLDEAKRRADKYLRLALDSDDALQYAEYVEAASKAGYDYSVWYKVLASLS